MKLKETCKEIRRRTLRGIFAAQSGHTGSSLSLVEILASLFFSQMKTEGPCRDRFILSKGHGAPALYAALSIKGIIPEEKLDELRRAGSPLQGHPVRGTMELIDASTGSLGQGLSIGIGYGLASRLKKEKRNVYVVLGDGELQEGQNWEAFMCAAKYKMDHLLAILDHNKYQNNGSVDDVMPLGAVKDKLISFGWHVEQADGHSIEELLKAYKAIGSQGKPVFVIANTVKGKGVSFIEGEPKWYCKAIDEQSYRSAIKELEA